MINAGERFNFILKANQSAGCYWMRFRGLGDCGETKTKVHQEAYICYEGSEPEIYNYEKPTYNEGKRSGIVSSVLQIQNMSVNKLHFSDVTRLKQN